MLFEIFSVLLFFGNFYLYAFLAEFLMERKYSALVTYLCLFPMAVWIIWAKLVLLWPTGYISIMTCLIYALFSKVFYEGDWKRILFLLVAYVGLNVAVYYVVLVPIYLFFDPNILKQVVVGSFQSFLLSFVMNIILYVLGGVLILLIRRELISYSGRMVLVSFFALQLFFLFVQPFVTKEMGWVHAHEQMEIFFPMLVIMMDVFVLLSFVLSDEKKALEQELLENEYFDQLRRNYYRSLVSYREEKETVLKDCCEKLANVKAEQSVEGKNVLKGKVQELTREIKNTKETRLVLHPVVDAILRQKQKECKEEGIDLQLSVYIKEQIEVEGIHLCNVFSNLLDNAIRANLALPEAERRILVKAAEEQGFFYVMVTNPSLSERTEKRKHHGYGMRILEDIAKKYEGSFSHSFQNGVYTAQIVLKLRTHG